VLVAKSLAALDETSLYQLVVAGGVGANRLLRERLTRQASQLGCRVYYPPLELCTDNGAMIALAGALRLAKLQRDNPVEPWQGSDAQKHSRAFTVRPRWDLEELRP
jgi:N6-L-threonylcarbamoyladenine synthase